MNTMITAPVSKRPHYSMRRIPGLDGLRAIAAGLVLVYHLIPGRAPLGYVGVDVFFVLSGFLITSLLLVSTLRHGSIRLGDFWARRFRRLFPAVLVATLGSAALAFFVGGDALVALGRQVVGSLTATYNWVEIAHDSSYFEEASPLLLTNMWSLAVEQQFYVVWPLVVAGLAFLGTRWRVGAALLIGSFSIYLHGLLATDNPTRAYMGTDTHLWGLMLGAGLAFALQHVVIGRDEPQRNPLSRAWAGAGWFAIIAIILGGLFLPDSGPMYPWGMVGASVLALLVIRTMLPDVQSGPAYALQKVLGSKVLTWLGVRSYGIYLWHWPLYVLGYYQFPFLNPYVAAIIIATLSIICADLSYRFVENPVRTMGVKGWLIHVRNRVAGFNPAQAITAVGVPLLVVSFAVTGIAIAPPVSSGQAAVEAGKNTQPIPPPDAGDHTPPPGNQTGDSNEGTDPSADPTGEAPGDVPAEEPATPTDDPGEPAPSAPEEPTEAPVEPTLDPTPEYEGTPASWDRVTIIGDSVTLASAYKLQEQMPGVTVDAAESRSIQVATDIISEYAANGTLGDYVVVSLATNGTIHESDITRLLEAIGPDRTLVLVTGFGPARASWIPEANEAIHKCARKHPDRIRVADWHDAIEEHPELLAGDSTHPGPAGADIFAATVRRTLDPNAS